MFEKIKILIVDDHPLMREALRSHLERHSDFEIIAEANDGQEAIEFADELSPDVIIMDITMPKLNGLEATKRIKLRHPEHRGLPGKVKLAGQVILGLVISLVLLHHPETRDYAAQLRVPFYKFPLIADMGVFSILFTILVLVGSTNAVNLTDGLDGLAIGCLSAGRVPPVAGLRDPLDHSGFELVRDRPGDLDRQSWLVLSAGFGGHAAAAVLSLPPGRRRL